MKKLSSESKRDFSFLFSSRVCCRVGDGYLRILAVLLVAADSKDPMIASLVLVSRDVVQTIINAASGPIIDRMRIRTLLITSDLLRTIFSVILLGMVFTSCPYVVVLILSFLGDAVFIFFKPAVDKVVKISIPVEEGTRILSIIDAANYSSNIAGYALASFVAGFFGLKIAVIIAPVFFILSVLFVSRLRLSGESAIDYSEVRKGSYFAAQREGLRYTWGNPPLRMLLIARSFVAIGRGAFTVLSVAYIADVAKGLSAYGYFESAQSLGKVLVTAIFIPFFMAHRSTFLLTAIGEAAIGLSFFGFDMVDSVFLACLVGTLVGGGSAVEAVGIDAVVNRYADAHIQGRAKSTTSFGSRTLGVGATAVVYFLVGVMHISARTLFAWLGIFPLLGAFVFFLGWRRERNMIPEMKEDLNVTPVAGPAKP